jgi:hypothetical protein
VGLDPRITPREVRQKITGVGKWVWSRACVVVDAVLRNRSPFVEIPANREKNREFVQKLGSACDMVLKFRFQNSRLRVNSLRKQNRELIRENRELRSNNRDRRWTLRSPICVSRSDNRPLFECGHRSHCVLI